MELTLLFPLDDRTKQAGVYHDNDIKCLIPEHVYHTLFSFSALLYLVY